MSTPDLTQPYEQRKYLLGDLLQAVAALTHVDFILAKLEDEKQQMTIIQAKHHIRDARVVILENLQQLRGD